MGSLFKPKQPAPPPPTPPTLVRDEINGVEQVPVTAADGSITYITRALPLTAAQQAEKQENDRIVSESLAEISRLSRTDYAPDEATTRVLDQWQTRQNELLARQASQRVQSEEEQLALRGLSDSTAAQAVRRQRLLDDQEAQRSVSLERDDLANQIRGEKLSLQQNLYNLASTQRDANANRTAKAATASLGDAVALNAQRQSSILDYYNAQQRANGSGSVFGDAFSRSAGNTIGGTIGGSVGGPFGKTAGSWLGSWLFGRK
jgi:hypothetical protein